MKRSLSIQYLLLFATYCLISVGVIYFYPVTKLIADWVRQITLYLDVLLANAFDANSAAELLGHTLALALTPLLIVSIPTAGYWLVKKKMPPYLILLIWVLWIIAVMSRLLS